MMKSVFRSLRDGFGDLLAKKPSAEATLSPDSASRRDFLKTGVGTVTLSALGAVAAQACDDPSNPNCPSNPRYKNNANVMMMAMPGVNSEVDHAANGFDPSAILTDFDGGRKSQLPNGQTLREYEFSVVEKNIEVVSGISYPAILYNGRLPGPTIRAREGDRIRITLTNSSSHAHSIHFHGIHPGEMDGVYEQVKPGGSFVYDFDAEPFGVHLYHCHTAPLAKHIAKGLYGAFIVEPKESWPPADKEFIMVMSGLDIDFDDENDFYVVNGIPFHYDRHPIPLKVGELVRIFVVNLLEYDQINSFHLHANFFHYYPTGTSRTPSEFTDTIALMQGQRGMMEFRYKFPGKYMFHAHKTEFAELGWTGVFEVTT